MLVSIDKKQNIYSQWSIPSEKHPVPLGYVKLLSHTQPQPQSVCWHHTHLTRRHLKSCRLRALDPWKLVHWPIPNSSPELKLGTKREGAGVIGGLERECELAESYKAWHWLECPGFSRQAWVNTSDWFVIPALIADLRLNSTCLSSN